MNFGGKNAFFDINSDLLYQYSMKNITDFRICRENFMTIPIVIYVKKGFYLLEAMNDKIESLIAAGLIEYWHSLSYTKALLADTGNTPQVLTFNHLSGSFYIWMCGCFVSFMALICEFIVGKFKIRTKLDLKLLMIKCLIKLFTSIKKFY